MIDRVRKLLSIRQTGCRRQPQLRVPLGGPCQCPVLLGKGSGAPVTHQTRIQRGPVSLGHTEVTHQTRVQRGPVSLGYTEVTHQTRVQRGPVSLGHTEVTGKTDASQRSHMKYGFRTLPSVCGQKEVTYQGKEGVKMRKSDGGS